MPPKRVRKTAAASALAADLQDSVREQLDELEKKLMELADESAAHQLEKILSGISEEVRQMNMLDFLTGAPVNLFKENVKVELEEKDDDVADDVSIPQVLENQSARKTSEPRRELFTASGRPISVPMAILPKVELIRNPREARADEEIAFSLNGSPMAVRR